MDLFGLNLTLKKLKNLIESNYLSYSCLISN